MHLNIAPGGNLTKTTHVIYKYNTYDTQYTKTLIKLNEIHVFVSKSDKRSIQNNISKTKHH